MPLADFVRREMLGEGAFGVVYRAHQPGLERDVALKVVHPRFSGDAGFVRRFETEARLVARIEHPSVVPLFEFGVEDGTAFLVMRYMEGGSLADALRRGPLRAAAAKRMVEQITAALAVAHRRGVVHGDIKPSNILFDRDGGAYLSDFGIAADLFDGGEPGVSGGTPGYLAPETLSGGTLDERADLYALGIVLAEALTGEHPLGVLGSKEMIRAHLERDVPMPPGLPAAITSLVERDPRRRPRDAAAVLADLAAWHPEASGPAAWDDDRGGNLPVQVTSFVGRAEESAEVEKLVRGSRLVTVTGTGGCGKSRLAVQVGAGMAGEFPDGVWLAELGPVSDPASVASTVANALGMPRVPGRDLVDSLAGFLRTKTLLLILDNCEHLIDPAADLVRHVLEHTPGVRVLATSREPLRVPGEAVLHLGPLPIGDPDTDPAGLARIDAVRLFAERAEAANPAFRLTRDNGPAVAGICARLDGIPLALELAASATRALTLVQIDTRLAGRLPLPGSGLRTDLEHHRTVETAIDWSYGLLDTAQQTLFERLGVFAASFTLDDAEAVCPDDTVPADGILDGIVGLADRSLLEVDHTGAEPRYRMLAPVRDFAATRLQARPESVQTGLHRRHCRWCLSLAEQAVEGPISADAPPPWLPRLDTATADIDQALGWAVDTDHDQDAVDLAGALGWYWHIRARYAEAALWYQTVPLRFPQVTVTSRIQALRWAAHHLPVARQDRPHIEQARDLADEALHLARQTGDTKLIAACLQARGIIAWNLDDRRGPEDLEEALGLATETGDLMRQTKARNMLAWTRYYRPSWETAARAFWETNLDELRRLGDDRMVALTLGCLSLCVRFDDPAAALRLAEEELELARRLGQFQPVSAGLHHLGIASYCLGDFEAALAYHQQEADLDLRIVGDDSEASSLLANAAFALGDLPQARRHFRRALPTPLPIPAIGETQVRRAVRCLGWVLAREGALQPAAVLLAAVGAMGEGNIHWIDPVRDPERHHHCLDLIAQGLTPDERLAAERQGQAMTLEQAADYARTLLDETENGAAPSDAPEAPRPA